MAKKQHAIGRASFGAVFINETYYRKENVSGIYLNETGAIPVGKILNSNIGSWLDGYLSYSYQWYRGTTPISLATSPTYTTTSSDIGNTIFLSVTATTGNFTSSTANTLPVGPVAT
jgi:hypothetical protein